MRETWVLSLGWEDPLEKGTATHSSILACIISWTVKSLGSQRVGHNWMTFTFTSVPYPTQCLAFKKKLQTNLSHGSVIKNLPDNAGDTVWSLYCEDPTCDRATEPMCHNYWAQALECGSHNCWSLCIQKLYSATREATTVRSPCLTHKSKPNLLPLVKAHAQQWRPRIAKGGGGGGEGGRQGRRHKWYQLSFSVSAFSMI